ncbi:hypothetical protein N656DRAFT_43382 [Canariomyces notabilis]|uniref:Uncharacterized protein n=1 Tax=Canariomyces notabilis TaxID=2074819 RepID=A0AAN6TNJ5_9PEZI|nr:hypothetical protein N656DRAFT_43382 [Canariomyces arenarius]
MPSFSMLRRSPHGRRRGEQKHDNNEGASKPNDALRGEDSQHNAGPPVNGPGDASDGEIKGRRGLNRELLQNIRNRIVGKPPSTPQRGSTQPQQTVTVRATPPPQLYIHTFPSMHNPDIRAPPCLKSCTYLHFPRTTNLPSPVRSTPHAALLQREFPYLLYHSTLGCNRSRTCA